MTDRVAPEELVEELMRDPSADPIQRRAAQHIARLEGENERLQGYNDDAIRATQRAEAANERLTALEAKWRERVKEARENLPQWSHSDLAATWALEACADELRTALTTSSHSAPKEGT